MSFYDKHVFFCTNQREDGSACCNNRGAQKARDYVKNKVKELGISNRESNIRINSAGSIEDESLGLFVSDHTLEGCDLAVAGETRGKQAGREDTTA